jgi:hypothetical protein
VALTADGLNRWVASSSFKVVKADSVVVSDVAPRYVATATGEELPSEWQLSLLGHGLDVIKQEHVQVSLDGEESKITRFASGQRILSLHLPRKPSQIVEVALRSASGTLFSQTVKVRAVPPPRLLA